MILVDVSELERVPTSIIVQHHWDPVERNKLTLGPNYKTSRPDEYKYSSSQNSNHGGLSIKQTIDSHATRLREDYGRSLCQAAVLDDDASRPPNDQTHESVLLS